MATRAKHAVSATTPAPGATNVERTTVASEREAREGVERIRAKFFSYSYWELGEEVRTARDRQWHRVLGLKGMGELMELVAKGEKSSIQKIYRALRIVTIFPKPTAEMREKLSEGNAYKLTELEKPKDVMTGEEWIRKAIDLDGKAFKKEVNAANGKTESEWFNPFSRLPIAVEPLHDELWERLATEVFQFDLDKEPGKAVLMTEALILMLHNTPTQVLREALVGEDGSAPPELPEGKSEPTEQSSDLARGAGERDCR